VLIDAKRAEMILEPLSIELGNNKSKPYKAIDNISWDDIPPFAVLTGRNGSGKTQLLQVLAYKLSGATNQQYPELNEMPFTIAGDNIGRHEIAYMPNAENAFRVDSASISSIQQLKKKFLERLGPNNVHDIETQIMRERVQRTFDIRIPQRDIPQDIIDKLPDDFMYILEYAEVSANLGHVFIGYQVRRAEMLLDHKSENDVTEALGKPPWDFVNETLASAEFAYRIVPPENKLLKNYHVKVVPIDGKIPIGLNDLSSGEKTILRTVLWFYNTKHNNIFPKLFLLDEPDAHLHPSMTRQFIDVLKNVLVEQYNVRVILTTHSPSTVALTPDESIFVMSREQPRIRRPASKAEAIGLLTAGLVLVSAGTKFILVEDEDDVKFYSMLRDILVDQGPSKDPKALKPTPSLVFMPGSTGKGTKKIAGGKNVVTQWIEKFDAPPLNEMVRGIIDLDYGNVGGPRIHVLSRYSIENYLLDPIVIFGVLNDESIAPSLIRLITPGDEHRLRALSVSDLQSIVEYVTQQVEPRLGILAGEETKTEAVRFTNDVELQYPNWMLTRRGKDLLPIYQTVFGQALITPPKLEKSFRRVRLVPIELVEIMSQLQQA
jgi:ABC-type Mn2+/Zn2+ transport system ATPase subunit